MPRNKPKPLTASDKAKILSEAFLLLFAIGKQMRLLQMSRSTSLELHKTQKHFDKLLEDIENVLKEP